MIKELLISMRPWQWYKNLVIFVSLVFSHNLFNMSMLSDAFFAFLIFCLISGSDYIINDAVDSERDKIHPKKKGRPIASGRLERNHALMFAGFILLMSFVWSYYLNAMFFVISAVFVILHNAYNFYLKNVVIVDVLMISANFVIRAIAGGVAIGVFVSPWLIVCTFLLALFLALGKRRHEIAILGNEASKHRKILSEYTTEMIDQMTGVTLSALIVSYMLYTFLTSNIYLMITVPFAIYGVFRYQYLVHVKNFGGETELVFMDWAMILDLILWFAAAVVILYAFPHAII